ncbi:MAG: YbcC family protein [Bacteroidota bacterium]
MKNDKFQLENVIHNLKHFLPSQAPLKDFIHHNTLHAFQKYDFHEALNKANKIFGYKTYLQVEDYRRLFNAGKINKKIIERFLPEENRSVWWYRLLDEKFDENTAPRCGELRVKWKTNYQVDLDSLVHPILFRVVSNYLDQGISIWNFPVIKDGFLISLMELESNGYISFFKSERVKKLIKENIGIEQLLYILVGDSRYFEHYLFDQQFAHPGYSGMVSVLSDNENALIDKRSITLEDFIVFELLLEIDALDTYFGPIWAPLASRIESPITPLFESVTISELSEVLRIWQESYEWTYYDEVINGLLKKQVTKNKQSELQAIFCIDDRECSIRRYIETEHNAASTFGTAGFFNVEFYFQPANSNFRTKVCPAPVTPKYLIKEIETSNLKSKDFHYSRGSHGLLLGWIITHTIGFWSALKLVGSIFRPVQNAASVSSNRHMHPDSELTFENKNGEKTDDGLQIGFTILEMADRLEGLLRSIGLVKDFASLVYIVGHGSSSSNNTHYAGYDCGACSGRPGSVNARVISKIGNHPVVRKELKQRGIEIPESTQFVGVLHDTSRDEFTYFDLSVLSTENLNRHKVNVNVFNQALEFNATERSRRFVVMDTNRNTKKVHTNVKLRSVSLFEPRPELNHATNTLCIVGIRSLTRGLFLDRRAFLNSFDYQVDPEGKYLLGIMNAIAPVCGGINLEYFFSRVDNQKLGAGTKLPHNVMGLIGVANGIDGDLRTGLPSQMIEVHDPIRLLAIVEHYPDVVLKTIQTNLSTYEWFENEWVRLIVIHPDTHQPMLFSKGSFTEYQTINESLKQVDDLLGELMKEHDNLPVLELKNQRS